MTQLLKSWTPALAWAGVIFYLSSRTWDDAPARFQINDKVAHLLVYGIFGLAFAWAMRNTRGTRKVVGLLSLGILFAASDEWHQSFVPGRQVSVADFLADVVGIGIGFLVVRALLERRRIRALRDL